MIPETVPALHLPHQPDITTLRRSPAFGPDFKAVGEAGARYVDETIRGAKPAQLPVEQMSWLQFAINLKTARTLGLSVPAPILELADVVYR
jgi:putative tryptophan/tyrosine transport system substrate-binding protein